jgi:predicted O-methyltransferase YrrM
MPPQLRDVLARARAKALGLLLPPPFRSSWGSYSFIAENGGGRGGAAGGGQHAGPSPRLFDLALEAVRLAREVTFAELRPRMQADAHALLTCWPGEHYRLLAALGAASRPKTVIEIGTASGLSALALLAGIPAGGRLVSFDIYPWDYSGPQAWGGQTQLRREDFQDGRLTHVVGDLSDPATFARHTSLLAGADLFFIDGPKDGTFERVLLSRLATVPFVSPPIVVFDDIRLWNMLGIWREIPQPKLDLTSFGHWSGTGLVEWRLPS